MLRFGFAGMLNTLFGYGVFLLLLATGLPVTMALVLAFLLGVAFNFQTSRRLVFQSRQTGLLLRFVLAYLVLFVINYCALMALTRYGLKDWFAQGLVVVPMAITSFALQRILVFRSAPEPRHAPPP